MEVTLTCIDRSQAQRYLGYGSRTPDDATARQLADCEQALLEMMHPQYMDLDRRAAGADRVQHAPVRQGHCRPSGRM